MANGVKKLQKVQFGYENVTNVGQNPGVAVPPTTLWRGAGGALDDQRTLNKVEESVGLLSDTLRSNISKFMGAISLPSVVASFEQIQHLFIMAFGGQDLGSYDGGTGSGTAVLATLSGGAVFTVTPSGGSGYTVAPTVVFIGGGYTTPATATASVSGGVVTAINIIQGGSGYTQRPVCLLVPNGAGSDSIYTTQFPTGTIPTMKTYTITAGDNFETEQMEYTVCTKIEFTGDSGDQLKVAADLIGRQISYLNNTAAPTLLTPTPVEDILFQLVKVYLDDTTGAFGTTQVANVIEGLKLTITINWKPEFTGDGVKYFSGLTFTDYSISGELTYIHNTPVSGSGGAKAFFRNQTAKLLRLDFSGAALATPGTTYSTKHLILDVPIKFSKPGMLDNKDGTSTVTMSFNSGYDYTAGTAGKVIVVTDNLRAMPIY